MVTDERRLFVKNVASTSLDSIIVSSYARLRLMTGITYSTIVNHAMLKVSATFTSSAILFNALRWNCHPAKFCSINYTMSVSHDRVIPTTIHTSVLARCAMQIAAPTSTVEPSVASHFFTRPIACCWCFNPVILKGFAFGAVFAYRSDARATWELSTLGS